jgi:hypothetical protein
MTRISIENLGFSAFKTRPFVSHIDRQLKHRVSTEVGQEKIGFFVGKKVRSGYSEPECVVSDGLVDGE